MSARQCARVIAIDGPTASGKSAAGSRLAARLGYAFLDTGTMYRAITWLALRRGVDPADAAGLERLARGCHMSVRPGDGTDYATIHCDGLDATPHLRDPEVERHVSAVSRVPGVRVALVAQQRTLAVGRPIVMVGRDIGTVVLPDAGLKVYLEASVEVRARRRWQEMIARGEDADLSQVTAALRRRDEIDSTRAMSPLRPAADAIILDTDCMTLDEVVGQMARLAGCD